MLVFKKVAMLRHRHLFFELVGGAALRMENIAAAPRSKPVHLKMA
jgi:hypothetical protein